MNFASLKPYLTNSSCVQRKFLSEKLLRWNRAGISFLSTVTGKYIEPNFICRNYINTCSIVDILQSLHIDNFTITVSLYHKFFISAYKCAVLSVFGINRFCNRSIDYLTLFGAGHKKQNYEQAGKKRRFSKNHKAYIHAVT